MSQEMIIRAWKDESYRLSLSAKELALLPPNPAGQIELSEQSLDSLDPFAPTAPSLCRGCLTRNTWVTRCNQFFCKVN